MLVTKLVQFFLNLWVGGVLDVLTKIATKLTRLVLAFDVINELIVKFATKLNSIKIWFIGMLLNKRI